jgi:hypothetical protein
MAAAWDQLLPTLGKLTDRKDRDAKRIRSSCAASSNSRISPHRPATGPVANTTVIVLVVCRMAL